MSVDDELRALAEQRMAALDRLRRHQQGPTVREPRTFRIINDPSDLDAVPIAELWQLVRDGRITPLQADESLKRRWGGCGAVQAGREQEEKK